MRNKYDETQNRPASYLAQSIIENADLWIVKGEIVPIEWSSQYIFENVTRKTKREHLTLSKTKTNHSEIED